MTGPGDHRPAQALQDVAAMPQEPHTVVIEVIAGLDDLD